MDYFESLRFFRAIVEVKSFRRVGDAMGVSPSIVSRSIASLEERLGARLFHRSTRHFSMTDVAERLYERSCRILDDIDGLEEDAAGHARLPAGVLRLVAHTTATQTWLAALISSFKNNNPNILVDVTLTERPIDLAGEGYDLGIVLPFMLASDLAVTRLLQCLPLVVVTTPKYLKTRGVCPCHPSELADHVFVTVPPSMHKPIVTFRVDHEELTIPIRYEITSNNPVFNRDVVLEGIGIGLLPLPLVAEDIEAGRFVRLLDGYEIVDNAAEVRLAYSTRTLLPAKVRSFITHATGFFDLGGPPVLM